MPPGKIILEVAANPRTPEARLRELGRRGPELRRRVAANPNAPIDVLLRLLFSCADIVLKNPSFSLALLAQPGLIKEMDPALRLTMARHPKLPGWMAWEFFRIGNETVRRALALNDATPAELLPLLATSAMERTRRPALARADFPEEWRSLIGRAEGGQSLSAEELSRLLDAGPWGWELATQQPAIPQEIALRLVQEGSRDVRLALARAHGRRYRLEEELVEQLIAQGYLESFAGCPILAPEHRYQLLCRELQRGWGPPAITDDPALIQLILEGPEPAARNLLAASPGATPALLDRLSRDAFTRVRQTTAAHPSTPIEALVRLATDPEFAVRIVTARHPALPRESLKTLLYDEDSAVQRQAAALLDASPHAAWTPAC